MNKKNPLLSICIPTYNRANFLEGALHNICTDPAFNEEVEIVISDNASIDDTELIGRKYANTYTNIHYFRNEKNIKDENFFLALSRGNGKYVKLFNDTLRFKEGSLSNILKIVTNSFDNCPLFIYSNIDFLSIKNSKAEINSIDDFVLKSSFMTTWIANFGCWKKNLNLIQNPQSCSNLQLAQVDWNYQIVQNSNKSYIYFNDYYITEPLKNKGGYNIYKVFITNYLTILRSYNISFYILQKEKYRLLKHFISPWYINLSLNEELTFQQGEKWSILFKEYGFHIYFYFFLIYWQIRIFIYKSKIKLISLFN